MCCRITNLSSKSSWKLGSVQGYLENKLIEQHQDIQERRGSV